MGPSLPSQWASRIGHLGPLAPLRHNAYCLGLDGPSARRGSLREVTKSKLQQLQKPLTLAPPKMLGLRTQYWRHYAEKCWLLNADK